MSTYVISDIHGALEQFMILLSTIGFDQGSRDDELYLLGDYGDWGSHSIETMGYVMDLDSSPNVHCLLGNHEDMFIEAIEADRNMEFPNLVWYQINKGYTTWEDYEKLSQKNKDALYDWLKSLELAVDIKVKGKLYMAAHAYPYFGNRGKLGRYYTKNEALWHRIRRREDPFANYHGKKRYDGLIIGHTPTSYFRALRDGADRDEFNTVFFGEKITAIDCGAKVLEYPEIGREYKQARLAALRLDDEKCFYVR